MHAATPLVLVLLALSAGTGVLDAAVAYPGGRIAISHDGQKDPDDVLAGPMDLALINAAGLNAKLVHFDYLDQIGVFSGKNEPKMILSATEGAQRFGMNASRFYNCLDKQQLAAAIANFKAEAEKSSASDPLWFICSGPMEMPWRCINAVDPAKRKYIHCISHSSQNNTNTGYGELRHTWSDLGRLGAVLHYEPSGKNWDTPIPDWYWLRDAADPDLRWLFSRNQKSSFDSSDSVSTYWLLSGATNGGTWTSGVAEAKALLLGGGTNPPPPTGNLAPTVDAGTDRSAIWTGSVAEVALAGTVSDDGKPSGSLTITWGKASGPAAVAFADRTAASTVATFTVPGTYVLKLTASDGSLSTTDKVQVTVADGTGATGVRVIGLTLIDAVADRPVAGFDPIPDGATIDLDALGLTAVTVRASVSAEVRSVVFAADGVTARTESSAPYSYAGDSGGDYKAWNVAPGTHRLEATPWSASKATGTAGPVHGITVTIIEAPTGAG